MRKLCVVAVLGALATTATIGVSSAAAATEFGDACVANNATGEVPEFTIFGIQSPSPLPLAAPSAGVITSWKLNLITPEPPAPPIPQIIPQTLNVLRLNPASHTAQSIGEASGVVGSGANTIPARIPVQAGDRLALYGHGKIFFEGSSTEVGTLYCEEKNSALVFGALKGNVPVGSSAAYEEAQEGVRVPAVAVLEPDVDGDGYGDETQDKCPQSAAFHTECPTVVVEASASAKRGSVSVVVTTSSSAPVTVAGAVKLGKGKTAKLSAKAQTVSPGKLARFTLKFTKKLKKALKALPPKRSLKLNVTATATDLIGRESSDKLTVKLKGQAKG